MEGTVDFEKFLPALRKWFDREMVQIYKSDSFVPNKLALVMGMPLWGDTFIDRFFDFCVPSLLAKGNICALRGACRIVIYTRKDDVKKITKHASLLESAGIDLQVNTIPPKIMKMVGETAYNKYWLLGTVQQLCLQIARRRGMGFHMIMPDHLYSKEYFSNLFRLAENHEAICQTTISGNVDDCLPELEKYRTGEALEVSPQELGDIVYRNMHRQNLGIIMNGREGKLPDSHFYMWVGKDRVHIHCCHMNVTYLSPEYVATGPIKLHNALDTELPAYMPTAYMPVMEDNMTFTELSDNTKGGSKPDVDALEWVTRVWATVHFRKEYMRFLSMENVFPISKQYEYAEKKDIHQKQKSLIALLDAGYEVVKTAHEQIEEEFDNETREAA